MIWSLAVSLAASKLHISYIQRDLGMTLEIFNCMPAAEPKPFDCKRMISGEFTSVVELGDAK
jgi:hypothetical protein